MVPAWIGSFIGSLVAVVAAGVSGAVAGWWIATRLGIGGVAGALVAVGVAMMMALALFALGARLVHALRSRS